MRDAARRLRWVLRRATTELSPSDLEDFHRSPDIHNVVSNGPERLEVVADVVAGHAPAGSSLLDLGPCVSLTCLVEGRARSDGICRLPIKNRPKGRRRVAAPERPAT